MRIVVKTRIYYKNRAQNSSFSFPDSIDEKREVVLVVNGYYPITIECRERIHLKYLRLISIQSCAHVNFLNILQKFPHRAGSHIAFDKALASSRAPTFDQKVTGMSPVA